LTSLTSGEEDASNGEKEEDEDAGDDEDDEEGVAVMRLFVTNGVGFVTSVLAVLIPVTRQVSADAILATEEPFRVILAGLDAAESDGVDDLKSARMGVTFAADEPQRQRVAAAANGGRRSGTPKAV